MERVSVKRQPSVIAQLLKMATNTTEKKLFAVLMAATALQALRTADRIKRKRILEIQKNEKVQKLPSAGKIQDHPLVSWLLGNSAVLVPFMIKSKLIPSLSLESSDMSNFVKLWASGVILVESMMVIGYVLINHVYAHIPFFSEKRPKQSYWEIFTDYLSCNTVVNIIGAFMQAVAFRRLRSKGQESSIEGKTTEPLKFLGRLIWCRVGVDALFWAGHKLLHTKSFYWIHKKHHEHNNPALTTNYHFTWQDLMVEAYIPIFVSIASYELLIGPLPQREISLMYPYMVFHEIMSHAGKPMPCMNIIPPLAPWMQESDDRNAWAHEMHHNRLKTNFSISYYFDVLMGTARWD